MRERNHHLIQSAVDLREMLRGHVINRSLECTERSADRRAAVLMHGQAAEYKAHIEEIVRGFYDPLPNGPLNTLTVSSFERRGCRIENVLFDSYPGWQVNASVFVPLDFSPPFPCIILPSGHGPKVHYEEAAPLYARSGYLTVIFDAPGQGEKAFGNDHFRDGVRCYTVGQTSSRYFVADALRCIDYLSTREDADISPGVAMTGCSGGGHTTVLSSLLDERIRVIGPSCCLGPLSEHDIRPSYSCCPETHMWRRFAEGIDDADLIAAGAPKPALLMAGRQDELYRLELTNSLADDVRRFYSALGSDDRFDVFLDDAGHCYSLDQVQAFAAFANRWLLNDPSRPVAERAPDEVRLSIAVPGGLECRPDSSVNMRSLTLERARELEAVRDRDPRSILSAASRIAGVSGPTAVSSSEEDQPFPIITHNFQQVLLRPEADIQIPGTFVYPCGNPAAAILHFDDAGRNRLLESGGLLARAAGFLDQSAAGLAVLTVDLRGWGDSRPAMHPYDVTSWGGLDRCLTYFTAALGDHLMSMRIRDGLASLAYLRTRREILADRVVLSGCGLGAVVALHVAALDGNVAAAVVWDSLVSFRALLEANEYTWPQDAFMPNVLLHYDLPELVAALPCPVAVMNPLDGMRNALAPEHIKPLNSAFSSPVYLRDADDDTIVEKLAAFAHD